MQRDIGMRGCCMASDRVLFVVPVAGVCRLKRRDKDRRDTIGTKSRNQSTRCFFGRSADIQKEFDVTEEQWSLSVAAGLRRSYFRASASVIQRSFGSAVWRRTDDGQQRVKPLAEYRGCNSSTVIRICNWFWEPYMTRSTYSAPLLIYRPIYHISLGNISVYKTKASHRILIARGSRSKVISWYDFKSLCNEIEFIISRFSVHCASLHLRKLEPRVLLVWLT